MTNYYYEIILIDKNKETHVYITKDIKRVKTLIDFAIEKEQIIKSIKQKKER